LTAVSPHLSAGSNPKIKHIHVHSARNHIEASAVRCCDRPKRHAGCACGAPNLADKEADRRISPRLRLMHSDLAGTTPGGPSTISGNFESPLFGLPGSYRRRTRHFTTWIALAATYTLAGKIGLALAWVNASASAVWAPSGIALAAVLIFGPRVWPGIVLGAFLTNVTTAGSLTTSILIAIGNTLEAVLGAYLVGRFAGEYPFLTRGRDIFVFAAAGVLSAGLAATAGVTTLSWFGFVSWSEYGSVWLTWWLGDAAGAVVFAPVILLWGARPRLNWSRAERTEFLVMLFVVVTVGWIVFVGSHSPFTFLCIPLCVWAGFRFGQREAATVTCLLSIIAVWGSIHGLGPFATLAPNDALLLLQSFMAVTTMVGLTVGAAVAGRRVAEDGLRRLTSELEERVGQRTTALQLSEARLEEAQEVAHIGSWEWRVPEQGLWWSSELYRMFGMAPALFEPSYESFIQLLHPDDRQAVNEAVQQCLQDGQRFEFERRMVRADGATRIIHSQGRAVQDADGRVTRILGTAQDITERKAAEEVHNRSERRLQTIIDAEPACVKLVSHDGLLLEMNRAGLEMIGAQDLGEVVGRPIIDLVHPADRTRFLEMHHIASSGSPNRSEFRIVGINGGERWVDCQLVPFDLSADEDNRTRSVLSVASDVTERKHLEDQLRQGHKMEAVGLLAGGIAHDFNNLLTAISGFTEFVLETVDDADPRRAHLLEVWKAAARAAGLTKQLLALSRRQILQTKVLDLNALLAGMLELLRRTIPQNIELVPDLDPRLENIRADPGQLEQVVLNLVVNASDAMPEGGQLRFGTKVVDVDSVWVRRHPPMVAGRYVRLIVSDTGIGMSPETRSRIFEPFFTTKQPGEGTGLGLATAYGIVKQSGGFIWVTSQLHRGTIFELYFPALQDAIELALPTTRRAEPVGGLETILLAEDDGAVRRLARDVLRKYGYTVLEARDGEEALSVAQQYDDTIHILITDIVMPGLSGCQLADRLSTLRPGIHILYSSGYSGNLKSAGLAPGLPLLSKPYAPAELLYKVREMFDEAIAQR
jgi:PAS domain S-box-containing protein